MCVRGGGARGGEGTTCVRGEGTPCVGEGGGGSLTPDDSFEKRGGEGTPAKTHKPQNHKTLERSPSSTTLSPLSLPTPLPPPDLPSWLPTKHNP